MLIVKSMRTIKYSGIFLSYFSDKKGKFYAGECILHLLCRVFRQDNFFTDLFSGHSDSLAHTTIEYNLHHSI